MVDHFNAIIIGGGPAGYVAAIRLSQLGKTALLIEKRETLGGACLNVGCIPTKVLLDASETYNVIRHHSNDFGISVGDVQLNLQKMMERKNKIVTERCAGIDFLMQKNKITRIHGNAKIISKNSVEVLSSVGEASRYTSDAIILATGSVPIELPFIEFNGKNIISSNEAISLNKVPESMIIIGAGAIGLELGSVWSRLGSKVSIVEMMPALFGGIDRQMAGSLQRLLATQGINFYMEHSVRSVDVSGEQVNLVAVNKKGENVNVSGNVLLAAAGRKPYLENLGLENAGVSVLPNGRIKVTPESFETTCPGIYAIGDIIDGPMLAHKAEEEGVVAAERICGQNSRVHYNTIAAVVYTNPEAAWVGSGEDQLKVQGIEYNAGRFLFRANARAHALNETEGMVKVLAEKNTDKILGMFIVGPRASELIAEGASAMKHSATVDDIIHTVHAHPTLSEVIKEAALDVKHRAIHS